MHEMAYPPYNNNYYYYYYYYYGQLPLLTDE